ncbi:MAG TPA: DNA-processing protein DprA [Solirubrobacteraceae bacterium]|jgi:DNA processing protein
MTTGACDRCLARAWLLARLAPHLERVRNRIEELLALDDGPLLDAVGGRDRTQIAGELARFDAAEARTRAAAAGIHQMCSCEEHYPAQLLALDNAPAVLHLAGRRERLDAVADQDAVAVVGARRASQYGLDVARSLAAQLGAAGLPVVSGMALGVDSAAHAGALGSGTPTVAVLPGSPERPYPAAKRALYRRIVEHGAAVSELPPGTDVWRWMFPARNRIIAGLAAMTVVIEAGERSGSLVTARIARELERPVGAVPGRVTSALAAGPNGLLASGALIVRGAQDVLDHLYGAGIRIAPADSRPPVEGEQAALLALIADGADTPAAMARAGVAVECGLAALAALELAGYVRREAGGRYAIVP